MSAPIQNTKGKFLIASPELRDPNFAEGVVFMCEHNENGAFGLLINRKAQLKSRPVFEGLQGQDWLLQHDLFIGGPVHANHVLILYRSTTNEASDKRIVDDIALVSSPADLDHLAEDEKSAEHLRLFLGCSGWGQNQLEQEILSGAWMIKPYVPDMLFSDVPGKVWRQNMARLDGSCQIIARMPDADDLLLN